MQEREDLPINTLLSESGLEDRCKPGIVGEVTWFHCLRPSRPRRAVHVLFQPLACGFFILLGEKMPEALAHQLSKEPTGVDRTDEASPFSGSDKGQLLAVAAPDDPLLLRFFKQGFQAQAPENLR